VLKTLHVTLETFLVSCFDSSILQLTLDSSIDSTIDSRFFYRFFVITLPHFTTNMENRRHSSRSVRMGDYLNRSSFCESGGLSGWPTPEKSPSYVQGGFLRSLAGYLCTASKGDPSQQAGSAQGGECRYGGACRGPVSRGASRRVLRRWAGWRGRNDLVYGAECCGPPPTLHSVRLRSRTRRLTPERSGDNKTTASVLQDAYIWGHMWPSTLRSSGIRPPIFPRRSTEREPVLARPTTYGGRHDEDGTSTGRFDF
jgi:hypothetical protein